MRLPPNRYDRLGPLQTLLHLRKHLWSLSLMRMIRTGIDFELFAHLAAELVLRQHSAYVRLQNPLRVPLHHLLGGHFLESPRPAGVMTINLVLQLVPSEDHLLGVDDNHVIAHIDIWRIGRLVLAHQYPGRNGREPS